ncbi:MAG: HEAT repeat domain-containing protein [Planctomycetota bacterium]
MRLSRPLGLLAATCALTVSASAFQGGNAEALFKQGLDALDRNDTDAAAAAFRGVLAADPSNAEAYRLWQQVEDDRWLDLLAEEGQIELTAKRILERARAGRQELRNDAGAIRGLLQELEAAADDPLRRREIAFTLGAKHGEFVVPFTLPALASAGGRSSLMASALVHMGHRVVPPLVAALDANDANLRANVAYVLGEIGDVRAAGSLMALAANDPDGGVQSAAAEALGGLFGGDGMPGSGAAETLVQEGLAYALESESVLSAYDYSTVVWRFDGTGLVAVETPRAFYGVEVAKRRFTSALAADPASADARAGLAMVGAKAAAKAAAIETAGGDVSGMGDRIEHGHLQALSAGADALDRALLIALEQGDEAAAVGAIRALGHVGNGVSAGLSAAMDQGDLRLRAEAAVAAASCGGSDGAVIENLGAGAGQEVLRQVIVIDGDDARREALVAAIEGLPGTAAVPAANGRVGLRLLVEVERADAVLVASVLDDVTADAVIAQAARRSSLESAAVMLIADDDAEGDAYGDRIDGTISGAGDVQGAVRAALDSDATTGQSLANDLAARAATSLSHLAAAGVDVSAATDGLIIAAQRDVDSVAIPALGALGAMGAAGAADAAAGVAADSGRSDEVRSAAALCLADLFRAGARPSAEQFQALAGILTGNGSSDVRRAVAVAMGALGAGTMPELQLQLLNDLDPIQ